MKSKLTTSSCCNHRLENWQVLYVGEGDLHTSHRDTGSSSFPISTFSFQDTKEFPGHCVYSLSMYQTNNYAHGKVSNTPIIVTSVLIGAFLAIAMTLIVYGRYVKQRNQKIVQMAARSDAIIWSLFPTQVRDRMFTRSAKGSKRIDSTKTKSAPNIVAQGNFHGGEKNGSDFMYQTKPIADLFTETTVIFADIVGFTAWSSKREPIQVFTLLETIYSTFDKIARRRKVFKVETIGDCYIAVTGLPNPQKDHAVVMARFARKCMRSMQELVQRLAATMGPDTADLAMRMGLHSGPVTAGVLRGENSRFQLFGDTMHTAARMETNGLREKIHISQDTADLLITAGKTDWITQREDGTFVVIRR
jgi:class 3 adenylate cyclase